MPGTTGAARAFFADEGRQQTTLLAQIRRAAPAGPSGAVDLILTKEVSRFARNTCDALQSDPAAEGTGGGIIFLSDGH